MKTITLKGERRKEIGKKFTKKARYEKKVPGVLYGYKENIHFTIQEKKLKSLIFTPESYIVDLDIDDIKEKAILKNVQFHPVQDNILHVDFIRINEKEPIQLAIPLKVKGLAIGIQSGGSLIVPMKRIRIKGLLQDLPDFLEVDVTNLKIGDNIQIKELSFDGLELMDRENAIVAQVKMTRAAISTGVEEAEDIETEEITEETEEENTEKAG